MYLKFYDIFQFYPIHLRYVYDPTETMVAILYFTSISNFTPPT